MRAPLSRLEPRQRAGLLIVALVYFVGWSEGRAAGRVAAANQLLDRVLADAGPRRA